LDDFWLHELPFAASFAQSRLENGKSVAVSTFTRECVCGGPLCNDGTQQNDGGSYSYQQGGPPQRGGWGWPQMPPQMPNWAQMQQMQQMPNWPQMPQMPNWFPNFGR